LLLGSLAQNSYLCPSNQVSCFQSLAPLLLLIFLTLLPLCHWLSLLDTVGYGALFLSSLLASSVLPLTSDGLLLAMLYNDFSAWHCLWVATLGNWVGGLSSYGLGYLGKREWLTRYFGATEQQVQNAQYYINRYGIWTALFCWLPFVGDPLVVALGFMRVRPLWVSLLMLIGRFLRYATVIYLAAQATT